MFENHFHRNRNSYRLAKGTSFLDYGTWDNIVEILWLKKVTNFDIIKMFPDKKKLVE